MAPYRLLEIKDTLNIEDEVTKEILEIDIIDCKDVEHFEKVVNDIINRKQIIRQEKIEEIIKKA
jgi:hypothetical protein